MDVIVTHTNADFDALASLVAASLLYPEACLVMPGSHEHVEEFLSTYQHHISFANINKIPLEEVNRLVIVDTRQLGRIGKFKDLIKDNIPDNKKIPIHIFDHHPPGHNDITGEVMMVREVGATTTILLEEIIKRGISISPIHATIFSLGIYEDTGSLTFPTTTPADINAVATLVSCQANLQIVSDFINKEPTPKQVMTMSDLLKSQKAYLLHGRIVVIVKAIIPEYIGDLSILVHKIMDMEKPAALFCLFEMKQRIWLIARSRNKEINVAEILTEIAGGGHACAASGVLSNKSILEAEESLFREIERVTKTTLKELPKEHLLLSRKLSQIHSVKPLMKRLPSAIQNLFCEIGQIGDLLGYPVFVVGGFVRDLLLGKDNLDIDIVVEGDGIRFAKEFADKIEGRCKIHQRFKTAVITFPPLRQQGNHKGTSRDGSSTPAGEGFKIDVATARREHYEHPSALPRVEESPICEDLLRRDFTINAMAIQLNKNDYGNLIDFFGGEKDINDKVIRVLHTRSFIDDPTRIFRAIRFETRLNFHLDDLTKDLIIEATTNEPLFNRLANRRVMGELIQILDDEKPQIAIHRLEELGLLKYIHPSIAITARGAAYRGGFGTRPYKRLHNLFEKVMESLFYFEIIINKQEDVPVGCVRGTHPTAHVERWLIYFLALSDNLKISQVQEVTLHLKFTATQREKVINGKREVARIINYLRLKENPSPSAVYRLLNKMSLEALIFAVAKAEALFKQGLSCKIKKAVADYLFSMKDETVFMTGDKLKQMGISPGPLYKKILQDILYARLDKHVQTMEDEVKWVRERWIGRGNPCGCPIPPVVAQKRAGASLAPTVALSP
ncbi:DHH family phosphoesterase [Candidatus Desantisbacteria bacterium]|nr:DHH family phosphoesterase [Candidatus Desantisbacteria bacterium]